MFWRGNPMSVTASAKTTTKYRWIRLTIYLLIIILLAIVLVVPGVLRLIYRADSQVALGNAKSVRMATQVIATQQYGLYEEILQLSEAPGDFWILQMEDDGYTVRQFVYRENEYTVWYDADADAKYLVYHEDNIIHTGD